MSKYYLLILLVFAVFFGFLISDFIIHSNADKTSSTQHSTEISSTEHPTEGESTTENATDPISEIKYVIKINKATNTGYVYELIDNSENLIRAFICSVSENLEVGNSYSINEKYIWKPLDNEKYCQYAAKISDTATIQSIPFYGTNKGVLAYEYYTGLGSSSKDLNNVYMLVGDAYWIYNNCTKNTSVIIYSSDNEELSLKPAKLLNLEWCIRWDPTDPDPATVWSQNKLKIINVPSTKTINVGERFDTRIGVSAYDIDGNDISSKIVVVDRVNYDVPGEYPILYVIVDIYGNVMIKKTYVTVI